MDCGVKALIGCKMIRNYISLQNVEEYRYELGYQWASISARDKELHFNQRVCGSRGAPKVVNTLAEARDPVG